MTTNIGGKRASNIAEAIQNLMEGSPAAKLAQQIIAEVSTQLLAGNRVNRLILSLDAWDIMRKDRLQLAAFLRASPHKQLHDIPIIPAQLPQGELFYVVYWEKLT